MGATTTTFGASEALLPSALMPVAEELTLQAETALALAALSPTRALDLVQGLRGVVGARAALGVGDAALCQGLAQVAAAAYGRAWREFWREWRPVGALGEGVAWYGLALVAFGGGEPWVALGFLDKAQARRTRALQAGGKSADWRPVQGAVTKLAARARAALLTARS